MGGRRQSDKFLIVILFTIICVNFPKAGHCSNDTASVTDEGPQSIEEVRTKLLENYHVNLLPPNLDNKPMEIKIGMSVMHYNMEETEGIFYANAWLSLTWNDSRLMWSANMTSVKDMRFADTEIWKPDITLYNNAYPTETDHYGSTLLVVKSDGQVTWVPPARLASHCKLNLIKWPYDSHTCQFNLGSWTHDGHQVDLGLENEDVDLTSLMENQEWSLTKTGVKKNIAYYNCCSEPYTDVRFSFTIQRSSPSYVACVILPIIIIALVNIFVFLLPPTSGEKITLTAVNFFILCVYLIYFEAKLPSLGDHLPLLVLLYACNLVLVGMSIIISVIVINLAKIRRPSRPPQIFRIFCNVNFAQVLCLGHIVPYVSSTHSRLDEGVEMQPPRNSNRNSMDSNFVEKDDQDARLLEKEMPYMNNAEWILLASMVDRISFIVYSVVTGILLGLCLA